MKPGATKLRGRPGRGHEADHLPEGRCARSPTPCPPMQVVAGIITGILLLRQVAEEVM